MESAELASELRGRAKTLRERAAVMERDAQAMTEEANQLVASAEIVERRVTNGKAMSLASQSDSASGGTRLDQLRRFFRAYGPAAKRDVVAHCEVPEGSIRALLNRSNFVRDAEGRWDNPKCDK